MKNIFKNRFRSILSIALVVASTTSCDDFFDINQDPNNPLDARLDQVLPTVQTVIVEALGNGSGGMSDLTSQYVHQMVQRTNSNFYFFGGNEFSIASAWPNLYAGALMDINTMIESATERESYTYLGIAQTMKAYTYSMMVDMWGTAAFHDFGKGTENFFPEFDNGEEVYTQALALLNEATVNLAKDAAEAPDDDDLIYGGDADSWLRLANSLKLKLYNQVRKTDLYNAAAVAEIIAAGEMMSDVDEGFRLLYGTSNNPENRHPLYNQDYVQANANYIDPYFYLIMSGDATSNEGVVLNDVLQGVADPRIPYYFYNQLTADEDPENPTTSAVFGNFLSIWFASLNIDPNEGFDQAQSQTLVGLYPAGGAFDNGAGTTGGVGNNQNPGNQGEGYTRLYPFFAHLYTRAELALEEGAPGDHRQLFIDAMVASFEEVNDIASIAGAPLIDLLPGGEGQDYIDAVIARYDATDNAGKLELILTEKWIASFGFSIDSYTDYRRTGFPVMFDPNADNNPFTILSRAYPVSIPYYTDDLQINPNAPSQRNPATDKVFWDVD